MCSRAKQFSSRFRSHCTKARMENLRSVLSNLKVVHYLFLEVVAGPQGCGD